jgi:hypothetical protein
MVLHSIQAFYAQKLFAADDSNWVAVKELRRKSWLAKGLALSAHSEPPLANGLAHNLLT